MMSSIENIKFSDDIKNLIRECISKTKSTQIEHGFGLCSNGEISVSKKGIIKGEEHQIDLTTAGSCDNRQLGNFHAHSNINSLKEIYSKSELSELLSFDEWTDINLSELDEFITPEPSTGDLANMLISKAKGLSEGVGCVGNDINDKKVICYIPKDQMPKGIVLELVDIFNKKDERMYEKPKKDVIKWFDKKEIKL